MLSEWIPPLLALFTGTGNGKTLTNIDLTEDRLPVLPCVHGSVKLLAVPKVMLVVEALLLKKPLRPLETNPTEKLKTAEIVGKADNRLFLSFAEKKV